VHMEHGGRECGSGMKDWRLLCGDEPSEQSRMETRSAEDDQLELGTQPDQRCRRNDTKLHI
jgi:hypothetical protein